MENNRTHVHKFKSTVVPSTCKEKGYTLHKCDCGYEHRDNFKPLSTHNYKTVNEVKATCTENGEQTFRCTFCGETKTRPTDPTGHSWSDWTVKQFATCTEKGKKIRFCTNCNIEEEQDIPAKGHNLSSPIKSKTEKGVVEYFCENCGETIKKPTKASKMSSFFSSHKKAVISVIAVLLAVTILVPVTKFFIIPQAFYSLAKNNIKKENYDKAYEYLKVCDDYKDSLELLSDFTVCYEKTETIVYDSYGLIDNKTTYEYDEKGYNTHYVKFDENLETEEETTIKNEYDKNGSLVRITKYDENDTLFYEAVYEYDKNGSLIHSIEYNITNQYMDETDVTLHKETRTTESEYKYEYDKDGNLIRKIQLDENGKVFADFNYIYDKDGNLTHHTEYNNNGELICEYIYEYDNAGNVIRYVYESDFSFFEYKYEYDKDGNIICATNYDEDGNLDFTKKHRYTLTGKLHNIVSYDEYGDIKDKTTYKNGVIKKQVSYTTYGTKRNEAKYDQNGNMIYYAQYSEGKPISKTKNKYDKNGEMISATYYDEYGDVEKTIKYNYYNPFVIYTPSN